MIDTIDFITELSNEDYYKCIKIEDSTTTYRVKNKTGEQIFSFTNAYLKGSYDSKISIRPSNELNNIRFSLSLHKLILGHNVYGGSMDLVSQLLYLKKVLKETIDIDIKLEKIKIKRLDIARIYKLSNYKQVQQFIRSLQNVKMRTTEANIYKNGQTAMWNTGLWTFRVYDKYSEFEKHDKKRLQKQNIDYKMINHIADGIIRIEYQARYKLLKRLYGEPDVNIDMSLLYDELNKKIEYINKMKGDNVKYLKKVYKFNDVKNRIENHVKKTSVGIILNAYFIITEFGEDTYRDMKRTKDGSVSSTFYRHMNILKDLNISLTKNNIEIKQDPDFKVVPLDFNLKNTDYELKNKDVDRFLENII